MNLFELFVKIGANTKEAEEGMEKTGGLVSKLGEKMKTGLATAAKVGLAAVTAAAAGVTALTKASLDGYANYEQLVGGVKTLFGTEAESVEEYAASVGKTVDEVSEEYNNLLTAQSNVFSKAADAYKNAGLSANEYMETVTSFAAALVSSVGGDTVAAAEKADMAITDMSDNANKMGSSMESIQNAYNGFAKQNYTMLDNLKLGYGGTKEEMQRLLNTANELNAQQGITTNYQISSYADIVDAIHVVQTEMGITGTTAKEAATTIQGSLGSAKAAWENLVTGIADQDADLTTLIGNFVGSAATAAENIIPRVTQILSGAGEAIAQIAPVLAEQIPQMLSDTLPALLEAAISLASNAADGVIAALPEVLNIALEALPQLIDAASKILSNLVSALIEAAPMLLDAGVQLIGQLAEGFVSNFPQLIQSGTETIASFAQGIAEAIPELIASATDIIIQIVDTLTNPESIGNLVDAALDIIMALADGLLDAIPKLIEAVPKIIENLVTAVVNNLPKIVESGLKIMMSLTNSLIQNIPKIVEAIPKIIVGIVNAIIDNLPQIIASGFEVITALITGLITSIPDIILAIPQIIKSIVETFKEYDWGEIGKNIIDGIKNGFLNMWETLKETVNNMVSGLVSGVKNLLGIASPSKVFAGIGGYMAQGLGEGFEDGFGPVQKKINDALDFSDANARISIASSADSGSGMRAVGRGVNVTQNIYAQEMTPSQVLQESIYLQKRAVMLGV